MIHSLIKRSYSHEARPAVAADSQISAPNGSWFLVVGLWPGRCKINNLIKNDLASRPPVIRTMRREMQESDQRKEKGGTTKKELNKKVL